MKYGHLRTLTMATIETLKFDNAALRDLPLEPVHEQNIPRQVRSACFSKVQPTPLSNPRTVCYSIKAMGLLDLPESELTRDEFPGYFSGSKVIPGSDYAAHCYCGHQFGYFSGQLGDGAALYVGEVVNRAGERWEVQFKGSGKTPYSRSADGRKVLRSSLREFLCSEAMYHLGVPTTRAGSCVVSSDTVVRDILYDGHPINEKCTVILRIAPTFLRFGSFEIFKTIDRITSRVGSSPGNKALLMKMLKYTKERFYTEVAGTVEEEDAVLQLFRLILERTAKLVASWQSVGFCHGVLNTDNMSILGLTIDYGPYGFMETFDPGYICNGSDKGGRYSYEAQPDICKWNLRKLGEMFSLVVAQDKLTEIVDQHWDTVYKNEYEGLMRRKLGLSSPSDTDTDTELFKKLFEAMQKTRSDFTKTFIILQNSQFFDGYDLEEITSRMITNCLSRLQVKSSLKTTFSRADCEALIRVVEQFSLAGGNEAGFNPLSMYGIEISTVLRDHELHRELGRMESLSDGEWRGQCEDVWRRWVGQYKRRLDKDRELFTGPGTYSAWRSATQRSSNPVVVPRNHILQRAIDRTELDDFSLVTRLLEVFESPYETPTEDWLTERDIGDKAGTVT